MKREVFEAILSGEWAFKPGRRYHRNGDVVTRIFRGKKFLKVGNQEYQSDDWANLAKYLLEVAKSRKSAGND